MKLKKSLGQNFFVNENLGNQILSHILNDSYKYIVEIGPGDGFFTNKLQNTKKDLLVIEKDDKLAHKLTKQGINTINIDFLNWNFREIENKQVVFFGSLPYNVSKRIISKIISSKYFTLNCYFIIQKEVADKYISKAPNSNLLALKTEIYANCKKLFDIKSSSFRPIPKVKSSFIVFSPHNKFLIKDIKSFNSFLEECFKYPRKTLKNNLKNYQFNNNLDNLLQKRPEHLSLNEYINLFNDATPLLV